MFFAAALESANVALFWLVVLFVVIHTAEEMGAGGGDSYWRYYSRWFVLRVGDVTGFALFTLLGAGVISVAYLGLIHEGGSAWWLSALLGLLVADFGLSHVGLRAVFPGENPGLLTSVNYAIAAALIVFVLRPKLSVTGFSAGYWVFGGWWVVSCFFLRRR